MKPGLDVTKWKKYQDFSGQTFGRWFAIKRVPSARKCSVWECRCLLCDSLQLITITALTREGGGRAMCLNPSCFAQYVTADGKSQCKKCHRSFPFTKEYFAQNDTTRSGIGRICFDCHRKSTRRRNGEKRLTVLRHYGGQHPSCCCCGEKHIEFLCIDHIDGSGRKHREDIKGSSVYRWLIRHHFPSGFRVLCMNCNFALGMHGYCPHSPLFMKQERHLATKAKLEES